MNLTTNTCPFLVYSSWPEYCNHCVSLFTQKQIQLGPSNLTLKQILAVPPVTVSVGPKGLKVKECRNQL